MSKKNKKNLTPVENEEEEKEEEKDEVKTDEKKPNIFKRCWTGIKKGFKVVKDNVPAAAVGAVIGTAATIGVSLFLNRGNEEDVPELTSGEPLEIEDSGEEYLEDDNAPEDE